MDKNNLLEIYPYGNEFSFWIDGIECIIWISEYNSRLHFASDINDSEFKKLYER